jgi:hypothetical protein
VAVCSTYEGVYPYSRKLFKLSRFECTSERGNLEQSTRRVCDLADRPGAFLCIIKVSWCSCMKWKYAKLIVREQGHSVLGRIVYWNHLRHHSSRIWLYSSVPIVREVLAWALATTALKYK